MDVYVIIGNPNTRKSSIARCLTGCFNRSIREIALQNGRQVLKLYARVGSLQVTRTSPDDFFAEVAKSRCMATLCCLSADAQPLDPDSYPAAAGYLARFKAEGWRLRSIAVLGQNGGGLRSALLRQFPQASTDPINLTARDVRSHFGWA